MYVDRELVRRVEHSAAQYCARVAAVLATTAPTSGAVAQPCDGGSLIAFGPGRYVNRAMGVGLSDTSAEEIVTAIGEFYSARALPASIEVNPWIDASILAALGDRGFRLERFRNVYVRELDSIPDVPMADIVPVDEHSALVRMTILAGDVPSDSEARKISDEYCEAAALLVDAHDFVALSGGTPAACGSLNIANGLAGLGGAATLPEHRGRGLQQALLAYRLRLARSLGCDLATATAVPDQQSARNLERLGFQLLYTQTVLTRPM
ncbi:MAG: GNAT family N-acetyltransferase [Actinobacteria bacterium]|nr:GNAT family N-acetyltransferase [Actinomycetota bacterium]